MTRCPLDRIKVIVEVYSCSNPLTPFLVQRTLRLLTVEDISQVQNSKYMNLLLHNTEGSHDIAECVTNNSMEKY